MSSTAWAYTADKPSSKQLPPDVPPGQVEDDSYVTEQRDDNEPVPVQKDSDPVEGPIDDATADSDKQLDQDESEAIDKTNIIEERTRGAKPTDSYQEPTDEKLGLTE